MSVAKDFDCSKAGGGGSFGFFCGSLVVESNAIPRLWWVPYIFSL